MRPFAGLALLTLILWAQSARGKEFEYGKTRIGDFQLTAKTEYTLERGYPEIEAVSCKGVGSDFLFDIDREGAIRYLRLSFLDMPDEEGDRATITLLGDTLWLYVDGRRYEFLNVPMPTSKFSNWTYPAEPKGQLVLPIWRGFQAIRASDSDPPMNLSRIYGEIVRAKKLEWGFRSRNWQQVDRAEPDNQLPKGWETRRYPVDNSHLREAIAWCTQVVASDAATRLPQDSGS